MATCTVRKPPQAPPFFTTEPLSILDNAKRLLDQSRKTQASIIESVDPSTATFANTLQPLAQDENIRQKESHVLEFYQHVSPNEELRAASRQVESVFKDFAIETAMREDIFKLIEAVSAKNEDLDAQSRHFLEKEKSNYIRNGLGLPAEEKDRFKEIKKRLGRITIEFRKNLTDEKGGIWFSPEQLEGVPEDDILSFERGEDEKAGKLRVSFKFPDINTVLRHAVNSDTRKQFVIANANKVKQNVPLLKEALVLRDEAARLLGYSNHAAFRLEEKMIKSPGTVNAFLSELRLNLRVKGLQEVEKLKELKKIEMESRGQSFDGHYYMWNDKYYQRLMLLKEFSLDAQEISEYFPLNVTIQLMLEMFEKLFGMEFIKIEGKARDELAKTGNGNDIVWHPDVQVFSAWDAGSNGEFLGYLYLDLHPRQGKFGHAANFNLRPGFIAADGQRSYPVTALVCNLSKPTPTKPSLLKHDEVVVLFHELGHGIHDLVGRTKFARYHGTMCVQDFCEAPSQLLENWCWSPGPLKALSRHYSTLSGEYFQVWKDGQGEKGSGILEPPKQIPDEMIEKLIQTKNVNTAIFHLTTLHVAIFDMTIHQPSSSSAAADLNPSQIWNALRNEIMPTEGPDGDEWGHHEVTFGQLVGDYDAGIYGYLLSQVYSLDIFDTFFKSDPMDAEEGRRYRRMVLENGGSRDEGEMLEEYWGRKPDSGAFYRELGYDEIGS
ncbi:metallopeptidase protein [Rutstroemia sp. NJR-2017a WRK4]|nr:metallopeptidase protein [Rutstroemia sp. NJR-2017a WRK4]